MERHGFPKLRVICSLSKADGLSDTSPFYDLGPDEDLRDNHLSEREV
jgi:hypothetical protein